MGFAPPVASASPERESVRINGPGDSYAIASWDWAAHNHMDNVEIYVEDTACNGLPAYAYFRVDADRDFSTTHRGDRECQGGGTNYSGLDVGPEAGNEIYSVQFVLCEDEATTARPVCEQTESIRNPARTSDPGDGDKGKCATPTHADWFPGTIYPPRYRWGRVDINLVACPGSPPQGWNVEVTSELNGNGEAWGYRIKTRVETLRITSDARRYVIDITLRQCAEIPILELGIYCSTSDQWRIHYSLKRVGGDVVMTREGPTVQPFETGYTLYPQP